MPGSSFKRFFVKAGTIADGVRDDADGEAGGETAAGATISGAAGLEICAQRHQHDVARE